MWLLERKPGSLTCPPLCPHLLHPPHWLCSGLSPPLSPATQDLPSCHPPALPTSGSCLWSLRPGRAFLHWISPCLFQIHHTGSALCTNSPFSEVISHFLCLYAVWYPFGSPLCQPARKLQSASLVSTPHSMPRTCAHGPLSGRTGSSQKGGREAGARQGATLPEVGLLPHSFWQTGLSQESTLTVWIRSLEIVPWCWSRVIFLLKAWTEGGNLKNRQSKYYWL